MRDLAQVVDFEALILRDAEAPSATALKVRDAALTSRLSSAEPRLRLSEWVDLRREVEEGLPGRRVASVLGAVTWALAGVGALAGGSTAAALLAYDGRVPINVLAWLLYMVAIPLALALMLGLGLLVPASWATRAGAGPALLGALVGPLLTRAMGPSNANIPLFGRSGRTGGLERWLLVELTQLFTLAFLVAGGSVLLVRVATSDLAFAWGTTLQIGDEAVARWLRALAAPWRPFWPSALPTVEDVAVSRFSRFVDRFQGTDVRSPVPPSVSAAWWQFSVAALATYGVLPRIGLWAWARVRRRSVLRRWPALDRTDVTLLLERLGAGGGGFSVRETQSEIEAEAGGRTEPRAEPAGFLPAGDELVIAWGAAAAGPARAAAAAGLPNAMALGAGAGLSLDAERRALEVAVAHPGAVLVLIPRNEPPIEDVLSFLRELETVRKQVAVGLLEPDGEAGWVTVSPDGPWSKVLSRLGVEVLNP